MLVRLPGLGTEEGDFSAGGAGAEGRSEVGMRSQNPGISKCRTWNSEEVARVCGVGTPCPPSPQGASPCEAW